MALQCPALLALGNISKDFVLQLVCCAVGNPVGREELSGQSGTPAWHFCCTLSTSASTADNLRLSPELTRQPKAPARARGCLVPAAGKRSLLPQALPPVPSQSALQFSDVQSSV